MPWQPATIVFPDIELELTERYRAALADRDIQIDWIGNTVPNPRRNRMLVIRRDGGTQTGVRDRPRVSLRVWAATGKDQEANDLAAMVMALAPSFTDGAPILAVPAEGRSGPWPVPDESGQPQRQMTIEFHTRGVPL